MKRVTGIGGFGFSANWETVPGDEDVARRVLAFLEDRRLLFGLRHMEDELHCIRSAIEIRAFMTQELGSATPGKTLADILRALRAACRRFVEAAGPDGRNFIHHHHIGTDNFSVALGELRALVGLQIARIADRYDIEVEPELGMIMPPDDEADDDLSFIPGFPRRP